MLCILYTITIGAALGLVGLLLDETVPTRIGRRWIWVLTITASMVVPPLYRARHNAILPAITAASGETIWERVGAFDPLILKLWSVSSIALFAWGLFALARIEWLARRTTRRTVAGVVVNVSDAIGPATAGLLAARVVIPRWVFRLPPEQQRYIVHHEEEHRRAHDAHLLLLMSLPLVLVPWHIPLYWQLRRLALAVEYDCDRRVVRMLGGAQAYGETLFDVATASAGQLSLQPGFLGGTSSLERRLRRLIAPRRWSRLQRVVFSLLVLAVLTAVLRTPHPLTQAQVVEHRAGAHE